MSTNANTGEAKVGIFSRIARFFRNAKGEMKRVVWPSRKQVLNNTGAVLVFMILSAIAIGGFDLLLGTIIKLVFGS